MGALTPLTVKSTKSMIGMQQIQPEIKKLQAKYKGAENRAQLNEELMRSTRNKGKSSRWLSPNVPTNALPFHSLRCHQRADQHHPCGQKFVSGTQEMIGTVCRRSPPPRSVRNPLHPHELHDVPPPRGQFRGNAGVRDQPRPEALLPPWRLVQLRSLLRVGGYRRGAAVHPNAADAESQPSGGSGQPQMQTMQKVMPIFFAYIYFLIPAAVVIYMITSTLIRIATQDIMFRTGIVQPVGERSIPARSSEVKKAASTKEKPPLPKGTAPRTRSRSSRRCGEKTSSRPTSRKPRPGASTSNGNTNGTTDGVADKPKPHPRSKAKRDRKAR